eukprot:Gregarina_sp_Pseudo_9__41@NODE_1028_length_1958_cov_5_786868_g964_i0_p1_GENE_NODE_1028_length_1958_cov_5_786868_g964_i0NODE_1028_length_1958_cov_5_786868_g964_i0_p1_ORF_typecomplete_len631_score117_86IBR/PF01485_21/3e02IBR/PF01485_21/1e05IBR/PF01485_21/6_2e14RRM_2/PF04059_12/0_23_NODE_1028_length_1958_cov_5_786868_g964_i0881893
MADDDFLGEDDFIWDSEGEDQNGARSNEDSVSVAGHPSDPQATTGQAEPRDDVPTRLVKTKRGNYVVAPREVAAERRVQELNKVFSFVGAILRASRNDEETGNIEILETVLSEKNWDCDGVVQDIVDFPQRLLKEAGFDPERLCESVVRFEQPTDQFTCPILCEVVPWSETASLPGCNHRASKQAWIGWFESKLHSAEVVGVRCMLCCRPVPTAFIREMLNADQMETWTRRQTDVFVQRYPLARNCPGKNCTKVVLLQSLPRPSFRNARDLKSLGYTISIDCQCDCGECFCFACGQESHLPIPCEIIQTWDRKNQGEADNVVWIFVNTKNCPSCKYPIEKNHGCMHMTCRCKYEFCWLCMGDWKKHSNSDYYRCNVYDEQLASNPENEAEAERKRAADSLERYTHFYERYRAHMQGQRLAEKTSATLRAKVASSMGVGEDKKKQKADSPKKAKKEEKPEVKPAEAGYHVDPSLLVDSRFCDRMLDALTQIIDGRRLLKFSYAFGYYADWSNCPQLKDLFEHQQGQLEWALDQISDQTEKFVFDTMILPTGDWHDFNRDLVNITRVVREFFNNMTQAFESDIVQVAVPASLPVTTASHVVNA